MQKEIEMERTKVREDRAKKMAELENEKVKMEIEVQASRERLEKEVLAQKAAMEKRMEEQRIEMEKQSSQFEMVKKLSVESSNSEIMTELAQSKQESLRLQLENEKLRSVVKESKIALMNETESHIGEIKAKYEMEITTLRKKNALDHKRMRILRNELAQQAEEADRLINSERSKLDTVLGRHSRAESRIAELVKEMNMLKSSVSETNIEGIGTETHHTRRNGGSSHSNHVHITRSGSIYVDGESGSATGANAESRLSMDNLK